MAQQQGTLTSIMPKVLAKGLMVLRQRCWMPRLVNGDYGTDPAMKGTTIDVPLPTAMAATAVAPSYTPPSPQSLTMYTVQVPLDQWYKNEFFLTDRDCLEIDRNAAFMPLQMEEAVKGIANQVNISIMQEGYLNAWHSCGLAGTTPFGTAGTASSTQPLAYGTETDATMARMLLNAEMAPRDNRRVVLDYIAEAAALKLAAFRDASQSGKTSPVIEGELGRFFGMDWYADDHVQTFSSGAYGAGAMTVNGAQSASAGSTDGGRTGTLSVAKAAGANWSAKKGDIIAFLISGVWQYHVVTATTTVTQGTNTSVPIAPALRTATAGSEAIIVLTNSTHAAAGAATTSTNSLVFHRDAIAFANRPLQAATVDMSLGNQIMSATDPVSGLTLRLEVSRQYKQTLWEFDILWGVKAVRPAHIVRLLG